MLNDDRNGLNNLEIITIYYKYHLRKIAGKMFTTLIVAQSIIHDVYLSIGHKIDWKTYFRKSEFYIVSEFWKKKKKMWTLHWEIQK